MFKVLHFSEKIWKLCENHLSGVEKSLQVGILIKMGRGLGRNVSNALILCNIKAFKKKIFNSIIYMYIFDDFLKRLVFFILNLCSFVLNIYCHICKAISEHEIVNTLQRKKYGKNEFLIPRCIKLYIMTHQWIALFGTC